MELWRELPFGVGRAEHHLRLTESLFADVARAGADLWWHRCSDRVILVGPGVAKQLERHGAQPALPVLTRHSGGGAVLTGPGLLCLDVALPPSSRLVSRDVVEDYRWLGEVWAGTLQALGVDAQVLCPSDARALTRTSELPERLAALACFGAFSPYEVAVQGRKIVGLSQVRRSHGVLLASAVHLDEEPHALVAALGLPKSDEMRLANHLEATAISLQEAAPAAGTVDAVQAALRRTLRSSLGVDLRPRPWPEETPAQPEALRAAVSTRREAI